MSIEEKLQELEDKKQQRKNERIGYIEAIFLNKDYKFLLEWKVITHIGYSGYGYYCAPPLHASGGKLTDRFMDYICKKEGSEYKIQVITQEKRIKRKFRKDKIEKEEIEVEQENILKLNLKKLDLITHRPSDFGNERYEGSPYPSYEHYGITELSNVKWEECCDLLNIIHKYIAEYINDQISEELKKFRGS